VSVSDGLLHGESLGDLVADLGGGGGHDVEVAGVGRQEVAGAFDLDEHGDPTTSGVAERHVELGVGDEVVPRHVGGDLGGDLADRPFDGGGVGVERDRAVDGVAHHERWLGRVQDDDRLASRRPTDHLDGLRRGAGELVDVLASSGTGRGRRHGGDDLGVVDRHDARHRVDHRDGRLPTAGDHVDVHLVDVLGEVGGWHHERTACGRREVDGGDARLAVLGCVAHVHVRRGGLEDDVGQFGLGEQPVDPLGRRFEAFVPGATQALGIGVDPDHPTRLDVG
jgi:hypothetical protein